MAIDKSLYSLYAMKKDIATKLATSLYFYWKIYKRKKERKAKEDAERKKKKKGKKKKGTTKASSMAVKPDARKASFA